MKVLLKLFPILIAISLAFPPTSTKAQTIQTDSNCYLPGPYSPTRCTVGFHVTNNSNNHIICLWVGTALRACDGYTNFGGPWEWVASSPSLLEFRRHSIFPNLDPDWPDAALVKSKGYLITSRYVSALQMSASSENCDVTVAVGGNIQTALNSSSNTVICLAPGIHTTSSNISIGAGKELRSANLGSLATIRRTTNSTGSRIVEISAVNAVAKDLIVEGTSSSRAEYGVLVYQTSNALVENVTVNYALIGVGINGGSNVELRNSSINYPGDQIACAGCAQPAVWISDSNKVRVVGSNIISNGAGPEGDGEIGCHNSPNVTIHSSTMTDIGAAGIYLVNCDYARVLSNDVVGSREWGLDLVNSPSSGSDYVLVQDNYVAGSRSGGAVLKDSKYASFIGNGWVNNRTGPNASGRCNGVNKTGNTTGFYQTADSSSPLGVSCND